MEMYKQEREEMIPMRGGYAMPAMPAMPIVVMYIPMMIPPLGFTRGLPGGDLYGGNNFYGNLFPGRKELYLERTKKGDYILNKSALDALLDKYHKAEDKKNLNPEEALREQ